MAAKQPVPFSADGLLAVIESLQAYTATLQTVHDYMTQNGVESLDIVNAKEMRRGLDKIEAFATAAIKAHTDYRIDGPTRKDS